MHRQHHLQSAVTYVCVSSLDCKFASLPCKVFQRLAKRRLCQRFEADKKPPEHADVFRYILLAAAVVLIVLGVVNGDPRSVMAKAVRICMECIGLG